MTPETLLALKLSIEHWERLAAGTRRGEEGIGSYYCALCGIFNCWCQRPCAGCPVRERTGLDCCMGTPYQDARKALGRILSVDEDVGYNDPTFLAAAQVELDFLRSLLPTP